MYKFINIKELDQVSGGYNPFKLCVANSKQYWRDHNWEIPMMIAATIIGFLLDPATELIKYMCIGKAGSPALKKLISDNQKAKNFGCKIGNVFKFYGRALIDDHVGLGMWFGLAASGAMAMKCITTVIGKSAMGINSSMVLRPMSVGNNHSIIFAIPANVTEWQVFYGRNIIDSSSSKYGAEDYYCSYNGMVHDRAGKIINTVANFQSILAIPPSDLLPAQPAQPAQPE